ncbi:putative ATP-grasp-modified RiPP [Streptomyces sp. NPDC050161]|uniref:putative ATP-grasp-modified RiPP n=1 Tax=Streptomyces sp. NPDC050161 TaxID=3365604 RepID=UPI0037A21F25
MTIAVETPSPSRNPQAVGLRPWGAGRLAPYPTTVRRPHTTVTVDPATQLGVFRDRAGHVVEMGRHGTNSGTETSTATNSDSAPDQGHDQDSQQD